MKIGLCMPCALYAQSSNLSKLIGSIRVWLQVSVCECVEYSIVLEHSDSEWGFL